jgi:hypothetical protein
MAESRSNNLRKGRTERAARVHGAPAVHPYGCGVPACEMAEFVNRSALLRHHEQQQEGQ